MVNTDRAVTKRLEIMCQRISLIVSTITLCFTLSLKTANAQFQSLPATDKISVTGEKIKTPKDLRKQKSTKRHIENNRRKKRVKAERRTVIGHTAGNFNAYFSSKAIRRKKLIARQRRKLGSS